MCVMKKCVRCGLEKPIDEFREQKGRNTRRSNCRKCDTERHAEWRKNNREHLRNYDKNRYRKSPDRWEQHISSKYGIAKADYERMLKEQGGKCAICGGDSKHNKQGRLNIDHCHDSGVVRGLLCWECNTAIGKMKDSPVILRAAAKYLEQSSRHKQKNSSDA